MAERGIDDVVVFGGGIIPDEDMPELERLGVAHIFTPGATTTDIVDWVRANVGTSADASSSVSRTTGSVSCWVRPGPVASVTGCGSSRAAVGEVATRQDDGEPVSGLEAVHDRRQLDGDRLRDVR